MTTPDPRYPSEIHELWVTLKAEVVWLHGRWIIYRQLYGTSQEHIDVLNRSASTFFNVLQKSLLNDVQLSISKLGDPAGTGTRRNLTLSALLGELERIGEKSLVGKLSAAILSFDAACTKLRHRRNKWIAHFDLNTMIGSKVAPLEGPSRDEIEAALDALREAMNCVELHYTESQTVYEQFVMNNDGRHLISTLEQGLRYRDLVKEKVIAHDDLLDHFKPGSDSSI
jgi:AbiU2